MYCAIATSAYVVDTGITTFAKAHHWNLQNITLGTNSPTLGELPMTNNLTCTNPHHPSPTYRLEEVFTVFLCLHEEADSPACWSRLCQGVHLVAELTSRNTLFGKVQRLLRSDGHQDHSVTNHHLKEAEERRGTHVRKCNSANLPFP